MTDKTKITKDILQKNIEEIPPNSYWYRKKEDRHFYNWIRGYTFRNYPSQVAIEVESVNIEFDKSSWSLINYHQFDFVEWIGESCKYIRDEYVEIDKETFDKFESKIKRGKEIFHNEKQRLVEIFQLKNSIPIKDLLPNQKFLIIENNQSLYIGDKKRVLFGLCSHDVPKYGYNTNDYHYHSWVWDMSEIDSDFLEKKSDEFFYPLTTNEYDEIYETFEDMRFNYNKFIECDSEEEFTNYKRSHILEKIIQWE